MTPYRVAKRRRRLAPPWVLAAFGAAMALALALIFPRASLFQQLGEGGDPDRADSVRVLLLRNLLRKGAKDFALQRDYIRQLGLTGNYAGAFAELDRLAAEWRGPARDSLWLLDMEVSFWALAARSETPAAERLRSAAEALWRDGSPGHRAWAAEKAGAVGEHGLAALLYLKVAEEDTLPTAAWYQRAADMSAAAGNCHGTSQALLSAHDRLREKRERKDAFLDALRALQACGRMEEALAVADLRLQAWSSDTEILLFLVQLARSADRPDQAQRYAQLLVKPLAAGPEP